MQASEFSKLVQGMYAALGGFFKVEALDGWIVGLEGLSDEQIRFGISVALKTCEKLPTPARVRAFAIEGQVNASAVAWRAAVQAVSAVGYMKAVCFRDLAVNGSIRELGGWPHFCGQFESESEVWIRKRFEEVYSRICIEGVANYDCSPLEGAGQVRKVKAIAMRTPPHRDAMQDQSCMLRIAEMKIESERLIPPRVPRIAGASAQQEEGSVKADDADRFEQARQEFLSKLNPPTQREEVLEALKKFDEAETCQQ